MTGGLRLRCLEFEGWGPWSQLRDPDFTLCFEESLLLVPNGLLILFGLPVLYTLIKQSHTYQTVLSRHLIFKMLTSLFLIALSIVYLILVFIDSPGQWELNIHVLSSCVRIVTLATMVFISLYTHKSKYYSSTLLLVFWPFNIMFQAIQLRTLYLTEHFHFYPNQFWLVFLIFLLSILMFAVEVTPKTMQTDYLGLEEDVDASPEDQANIYSFLTFSWMSSLLELGASKHLVAEDLWNLPKAYQVLTVSEQFQEAWTHLLGTEKEPSLTRALVKAFGGPFFFAALFKLAQDILGFVQPTLLKKLIAFISSYSKDATPQPMYYGFAISFAMLVTAVVQTAFLHQYFQLCMVTGMKLRTALVTAIYQKSLKLSSASGQTSTVGEIVNHMSVDAQRLQDLCSYVHVVWSGVFQIAVALYLLYLQVGVSVFAGFTIMVLAIPLNFMIGRRLRGFQQVLLKVKDSRIKLMDELLSGMKVIKLYAWEKFFLNKLFHIRNDQELATLRKYAILNATSTFTSFSLPLFVSFATFTVYSIVSDEPLTAETVFVTLSLLNLLSFPLNMLPYVLTSVVEASVSVQRIQQFLTAEELDPTAVKKLPRSTDNKSPAIEVFNGSFSWSSQLAPSISNVNFRIPRGQLVGIVGRVGSGKSSFISSLLGDMNKKLGDVTIRGSVAYVPQQPWIMNATVRDNITFGHRFEPDFYNETIKVCALKPDLDMLISGDLTEIGERGINLSGGQKARISLARAVYARADIYLMDDPLSAVDAHVGKHIFDHVLSKKGVLRNKTRVLVTHAIHFLDQLDQIAMFEDGRIAELGSYTKLKENPNSGIHHLITSKAKETPSTFEEALDDRSSQDSRTISRTMSTSSQANEASHEVARNDTKVPGVPGQDKLMSIEESAQGSVSFSVYLAYFKACSIWGVGLFLCLAFASQLTSLAGMLWLKRWTEVGTNSRVIFNILVYGLIGVGSGIVTFFQFLTLYITCGLKAAKTTHNQMVMSVVRAPMTFFDTTPLGRIVNRFSKDQSTLDETLPRSFGGYTGTLMRVIFVVGVISFSTPPFLVMVLILSIVYYYIQRYYLATSRELKRLDSVSRSPIFAHFQETLGGASSIRAYQQQFRFVDENENRLEANLRAYYPSVSLNRWLAVRLEFLGAIIIFSAAVLAVLTLKWGIPVDPAIAGLSVTYALNVTQSLNWCIRTYCEIETNIVSMERIKQYIDLQSEAPYDPPTSHSLSTDHLVMNSPEQSDHLKVVPKNWPSEGKIEFKGYSTRYRAGLDLVLRDLSLIVQPGEKVGIVGRTGAGKSSLTLALFRIVEAAEGKILVDGIDLSSIALYDLRSRLSIIPQDPVLFAGSVRDNLDPFGTVLDGDLWRALDHANLKEHITKMEGQLDAKVSQGGENFSVGQRQLICLARALLRHSNILVLDEATAAIDYQTDNLIQKTIRDSFKHCTVLTIAHRINTVMDGDKILVLDHGRVKEFDSPAALVKKKDSLFYGLAKEAGLV